MSDITVRQLEYFLAVVDHGSISACSRELHVSQAAVSVAIRQLERTLNAEVLSRAPARRAQLTPAGRRLMVHARRVVTAVADAVESVRNDHSDMRGQLRIVCSLNVSPHVLPPLLAHFAAEYPDIAVEIREGIPPEVHQILRAGEADLAVVYARQASPDFRTMLVEQVRQHVILPAGHPLAGSASVRLADLIEEPLILVDMPPSIERVTQSIMDLGLVPDVRWTSKSVETVRSMVAHGLGWSFVNMLPRTGSTYDGGRVVYVPIADEVPANPVVAMYQRDAELPARVRAALDYLADFARRPEAVDR